MSKTTEKIINIENIKFDKPANVEFRRQKSKIANKWCRHLVEPKRVEYIDSVNDCTMVELTCPKCKKILTDNEVKQIKLTLKKYELKTKR